MLLLQLRRKAKQILQASARNDDVLVQLREPCITERVGKFTANFPNLFAFLSAEAALHKLRFFASHDLFQITNLPLHGFLLPVEFHNHVRPTTTQSLALRTIIRRRQRERIRHFERAWQRPRLKNRLYGADGIAHRTKPDRQARTVRWQGKQFQRGFDNEAEHPLRSRTKARKLEN